jgi:hypothetical protein
MKSTLIFIWIIFMFACTSKTIDGNIYFTEKDLPPVIALAGEKYNIPEILNPRGLMIKDGLAVVFERKNNSDDKFHIIDLDSRMHVASKGVDGLGPGEITVISQIEDTGEPNKVWTYDPQTRIFSKFDLRDTSKLAEEQVKSPETAYFLTYATWTSDTTLLGNTVHGWDKYIHITIEGDTLALFGNWKDMIKNKELPNGYKEDELDAYLVSNIFQGTLKGSPDKKYFIKSGMYVDYIDIVNLENYSIKTIYGPRQEIPEFTIGYWDGFQMPNFGNNLTERYLDFYPGENSFFALFFGKPYKELGSPENLNRIFEFDYSGNILNHYQLDYPVYGIKVDEKNRAIYAVTVDREPNLVRFDY